MKQHLRSFLTLLMLVVWCSGFAASGDIFTLVTAESELKAGDVIIIVNQTAKKALSTEQRDSNRGACAITISGKNVTKADNAQEITLEGASGAWYFNVGNGYLYAASSSYNHLKTQTKKDDNSKAQITFSSSSATIKFLGENSRNLLKYNSSSRIFSCYNKGQSAVAIYKKKSTKTATTLTFPKPTINIEEGNETTFAGQPATLKTTGETVLNKTITYTTNNDAMFEAYEANVGPKALKASAYGTAIVTAKFNGDDTYEASTATYTVNYTEKEKPATTLDFGFTTKTVNIEEIFTAAATLKSGETAITGAVTYSSSTPEVAYVDEATGEVMALTAGKATITATFAGTSEYKSSTASYELTVVDPNAIVPLVFDKADDVFGTLNNYDSNNATISEYSLKGSDGNSYTFKTNGGKDDAKNGNLKLQKNAGTLESPIFENLENGYTVNITFSQLGKYPLEITSGEDSKEADITSENGKNTEGTGFLLSMNIKPGNTFTLNAGNVAYISKIEIVAIPGITLDENADDTNTKIEKNNGKTVDVKLTRSLKAGLWNTICLPFDVTAEQVESVLKATGNVKEFDKEDKATATIFFKPATEMKAGVPYLIKPTEDAKVLNFKDVTINNVEEIDRINGNDYCICGVFGKYAMKTNGTELFLNAAGKFVAPAAATNTMKGFRAYFMVPSGTSAAAININIDGETTGINSIETEATVNGKVYNLNGQYVGNSLNGLKKGIYVVNGKKVIK